MLTSVVLSKSLIMKQTKGTNSLGKNVEIRNLKSEPKLIGQILEIMYKTLYISDRVEEETSGINYYLT